MPSEKHIVSVVLLTKNSAETVNKTLESIFAQTRKPEEVIVVDGKSTDGTLDIVNRYPVKLVTEPGLGFGYARNLGVQTAKGDIICFIDSDCYAEPDWIEKILRHFDNPEIAGVTGPTNLWNTESMVARFLALVGGRVRMPTTKFFMKIAPTMNLAVRRSIVSEVDGFDEMLVRCEDTELTYNISKRYKILYDPEAVMWFRGSPNFKTASKKCVNHFIGVGQLFAKHGFNPAFVRLNLPLRGFILIAAILSLFFAPWYVPTALFFILLVEFVYKTIKMYMCFRDSSVVYYVVFFTFWSLVSFAIFYGYFLGLRQKNKRRISVKALGGRD
ncbi:MAG: glycosyltransferase [Candidatus Bathyarchaeales archaeon]